MRSFFYFLIWMLLIKTVCIAQLPHVTIGIVYDGKELENTLYFKTFREETLDLLKNEYDVEFINFFGNWSFPSSQKALEKALVDPKVNIILAAGGFASDAALEITKSPKPILVPAVVAERLSDPDLDGKTYFKEHNVVVVKYIPTEPSEVELFYEAAPFEKVAIVAEESLIDPANNRDVRKRLQQRLDTVGAKADFYPLTDVSKYTAQQLEHSDADAIIFLPTWRLPDDEFSKLMDTINRKKLPSLSTVGEHQLELGTMMTTVPKNQVRRIARRIALNIQEILLNGESADLSYIFPQHLEVVINQTVADQIGIHPSWEFLSDARFMNIPKPPSSELFTLCQSAELAIYNNIDLNAERFTVLSGRELVRRARSFLGPEINSRLEAQFIDADRARNAGGMMPQRALYGALEIKQQIYDDNLWADYSIEKWLQRARVYDLDSFRLDVTFGAAVSYLEVLKIRAEYQISKENLELSRANLKRAQDRVDSGEANKSEVYRWESEIARNQDTLFSILARVEVAETEYNRILNRHLEAPVLIKDVGPSDPDFLFDIERIGRFLDNRFSLQLFKDCMIVLGRYQSPEIRSVESQIGAQSRKLLATKRAFYVPKFFLCGEIESALAKGGAGSSFPPGVKGDLTDSTLIIDMRYPIFTSGRRYADRNRATYDLGNLSMERLSTIQRVDQSVINSIDNMRSSYLGISLARRAAEAAEKNLRIVAESYGRGVVSIVDLIDAQNNALVSRVDASNAVYDFLIDFMALQRATGKFACFMTQEERACIIGECDKYMKKMNKKYDDCRCCYE